jgi:hypothetical protein
VLRLFNAGTEAMANEMGIFNGMVNDGIRNAAAAAAATAADVVEDAPVLLLLLLELLPRPGPVGPR